VFGKNLVRLKRSKATSKGAKYIVPVWWLEKHTADIVVDANSPGEATEKVEDMIDSGQLVLAGNGKAGEMFDWNTFEDARPSN